MVSQEINIFMSEEYYTKDFGKIPLDYPNLLNFSEPSYFLGKICFRKFTLQLVLHRIWGE